MFLIKHIKTLEYESIPNYTEIHREINSTLEQCNFQKLANFLVTFYLLYFNKFYQAIRIARENASRTQIIYTTYTSVESVDDTDEVIDCYIT